MRCDDPSLCPYPLPEDEDERLHELSLYGPVDGLRDPIFQRITNLVSGVFDCPVALVSLVAEHKQHFAARVGIDAEETSRDVSFCTHAIANRSMLVVPDATKDDRFKSNALVLGPPGIRFYAGAPLVTPAGHGLGSLCVIDYKPRHDFTDTKKDILRELADVVVERLNLRRAEMVQDVERRRFKGVTNTSPDCILCIDGAGMVRYANDAAQAAFGTCVSRSVANIIPSWDTMLRDLVATDPGGDGARSGAKTASVEVKRADGCTFPAEISASRWRDADGAHYGLILRDVAEKHAFQAKLERMALFDALTGLPNRNRMLSKLEAICADQRPATLVLLDIDGFKQVNDALGHKCGDEILRQAADRLKHCAPDATLVARLGGDEFCFVVERDLDPSAADRFVRGVKNCFTEEFVLESEPIHVDVSIGVATTPRDAGTPEDLFSAAELALYEAKNSGRARASVFRQELRDAAVARRHMECELQRAFKEGEFEVFYQPQVTMADNTIVGAEALIRWRHPERGLLAPSEFLPVLSAMPLSRSVDEWVLDVGCRQASVWRDVAPKDFRLGVNLFKSQLRSGGLFDMVRAALERSGLPPEGLELEITEDTMLRPEFGQKGALPRLRDLGVSIAFDDYGTGYASLSQLKDYPVTRLKIDSSFVANICRSEEDRAVVLAVLYLGRSYGLEVIAEGVEDTDQLGVLNRHGCLEVQGYLFGKPMPAQAFDALLRSQSESRAKAPLIEASVDDYGLVRAA